MAFNPVQAQSFFLAGSGAVIGDTSITLKSFTGIDGALLTMTDFGAKGYITLEPGNSTLEEQASFTGVTQNANGTATLTGIKNVLFITPYTESSGLSKTHAGSTTVVLSNTSGYYTQFTKKANDETIAGTWTFTNPNYPKMDASTPLPTDQAQLATKAYVDSVAVAGAPDATTAVKGIVQLPTQAQVDAKTALGSTGASLVVTPATQRTTLLSDYVIDTGAADAYAIAPSPAISAYATGQQFTFKAINTNTGTSTLAVNGLTTKTIKKVDGATNLSAGDIVAGQIISVEYDGTNFQMLNPLGRPAVYLTAGVYPAGDGSLLTNLPVKLLQSQYFTSSGTWTRPTGITTVKVRVVGAGGGGGGCDGGGTNLGGGGGAGGYAEAYVTVSGNVTVTVGTAGTAGTTSGTDGGAGGNSSFAGGTTVTANGGSGGSGAQSGSSGNGGAGGSTTNGSIAITGQAGRAGAVPTAGRSGSGGNATLGQGGYSVSGSSTAGLAGGGYGSGGSGGSSSGGSTAAGGAGAGGLVVVEWVT